MTHRYFPAVCLAITLMISCVTPSSAFQIAKTTSGLTVIVEEDHSVGLAAIDVWVKSGSGAESVKLNGISHMIEHLVYGATEKRKSGDMDVEMESIGATLDAHTARDWAHFNTTVDKNHVAKALDVLADALKNAQFSKEDIDRERMVILDEIARKSAKPIMVCSDYLAGELYGDHSYALPIEGTHESIKKITREDIIAYYRANYVPENMAVVIVGDVNAKDVLDAVELAFQNYPNHPTPAIKRVALSPPQNQINKSIKAPFKNTYISIGFLGPSSSETADFCATDVLLAYLGFGYRSWMTSILKDKMALAHEVYADFLTQRDPGMISLIAGTWPEKTEQAKEAILQQIDKICKDGLTDAELSQAKRSLIGQFAFDRETYAGRATSIGFYHTLIDASFCVKYTSHIQAVTNAEIIRVANKYLDPRHAVVLNVEPRDGGEAQ